MAPHIGDRLGGAGWQQGSCIPAQMLDQLSDKLPSGAEVLVVVSQDCDLVRDDETEPNVELLCGRAASEANNAFLFGRHPRMLVVPTVGGAFIELDIRVRISIPKLAFQSDMDVWGPNLDLGVRIDHRRILAEWLASRYTRPAFPDCFNARISRKADQKLGALTKSDCAQNVSGVYLDLGNDWQRDLPEGTSYQARFWFTCRREIYEGSAEALEAVGKFAKAYLDIMRSCAGIAVVEDEDGPFEGLRGEHMVTLEDLREFRRFDYDYRTRQAVERDAGSD